MRMNHLTRVVRLVIAFAPRCSANLPLQSASQKMACGKARIGLFAGQRLETSLAVIVISINRDRVGSASC
jgi:hypothetical protein